jgi:hypothetical protein
VTKKSFADAWDERARELLKRAQSGKAWAARMARRLGTPESGDAASRWIGIESGGNPRASSSLNERGLAQVSKQSLKELGLDESDFNAMDSARTTDDQHADMAAAVIAGEVVNVAAGGAKGLAPGWGPQLGQTVDIGKGRKLALGVAVQELGIGIGKLRHGLPLLLRELRDQGHVRVSVPLTIRSALSKDKPFKPSARLAAFAGGPHALTGIASQDLLLRFLVPVAVVAFGSGALGMGGESTNV